MLFSADWLGCSLGSLNKPRLQQQWECHQTRGLISKKTAMHMHYESLWNDQVLLCLRNMDYDSSFFIFLFGIECNCCIFSLGSFLESLAHWTDVENYLWILLVKCKFIFYMALSSASSSRLLKCYRDEKNNSVLPFHNIAWLPVDIILTVMIFII